MYNASKPDLSELPSTGRLLCATGLAGLIAAALLVFVVLPAEYAVDLTGVGRMIGLTQMGEVKRALAAEAANPKAPAPPTAASSPAAAGAAAVAEPAGRTEEVTLTLAPDQAAEIKAEMRKGATIQYLWVTDGPNLNFDTHGDGSGISYHGYGKGSEARSEGSLTAAFDGSHGWFWRNRSKETVTVRLRVSGDFVRLKRVV